MIEGITRAVPADLIELRDKYGDKLLSEIITDMRTETGQDNFDCPQCRVVPPEGEAYSTGMITFPIEDSDEVAKVICPVCQGFGKTALQWEEVCAGSVYRTVDPPPPEPPMED